MLPYSIDSNLIHHHSSFNHNFIIFFLYFCNLWMNTVMDRKKQIVKFLSALGLFIALMIPTIVQFVHIFDVHEHVVCTDQDLHVDQTQVECDICKIQVPPFDYSLYKDSETFQAEIIVLKAEDLPALQFGRLTFNSNPLRGPPSYILS